jgi:ligand-binding sensor domain-containing protein
MAVPVQSTRFRVMVRTLLCPVIAGLAFMAQAAHGIDVVGSTAPVHTASFRSYGIEEGLPQASVNALLQTRDGYLWIGTYGGLVRFDGDSFTTFHASPGGLSSSRIQSLHEDSRGRLWIGTHGDGIALYESGRFRPLDVCDRNCRVNAIRPSADGRKLWIVGSQGVFEIDPDSLQYRARDSTFDAFGSIAPMPDGNVYAAGPGGLARIDTDAVVAIGLPAGTTQVRAMEGRGRYLFLITDDWRLHRYDIIDRDWTLVRTSVPAHSRLTIANDGRLLLSGWREGGIWLLHDDGRTEPLADIPEHLHARQAYADHEGNLWIGTDTQGLWRIRPSRIGLMQSPDVGMDGPGYAVAEDGDGGMWFAMACDGLRHWDRDGVVRSVQLESTLGNDCVRSLAMDDRGRLWIGTWQGTLGRLADGHLTLARSWPQGSALNVWQNPEDRTYWAGTLRDTWQFDVDERGEVVDAQAVPALDGMVISFMTPARRGGTWFVGDHGAYRLVDGRIVEQWLQDDGAGRFLRWLYEDPDGRTLWIGSYGGGLVRIRDGEVQRYDTSSGLFDDAVSCILPDAEGRLWLGGNSGVTLLMDREIGPKGPELIILSSSDGLVPPELNGGTASSCLRDSRGRLWFTLIKGFAVIDPARFERQPRPPIAHVEHLRIAGRDLDPAGMARLDAGAGNLEIGYTAIGLSNPERLRFRYRLAPTGAWFDAGDNRNVLLPTLPWGRFAFEIQARHLGGPWSESVEIWLDRPLPWYRRQWIWLVLSLACLLALLWSTRDRRPEPDYQHLIDNARASRRNRDMAP